MKRDIADILEDFLSDINESGVGVVWGEKAKNAAKEIVDNYAWNDERRNGYKEYILEQAEKLGKPPIDICISDMLNKIVNAPTTIHAVSVPRLIMPVIWEFMQG